MKHRKMDSTHVEVIFDKDDLVRFNLNRFISTSKRTSRPIIESSAFERRAMSEVMPMYEGIGFKYAEAIELLDDSSEVRVILKVAADRRKDMCNVNPNNLVYTTRKIGDKEGLHMDNVIFVNSKKASVTVDGSFSGAEKDIEKLAKYIGQYGNISGYNVIRNEKTASVLFSLEKDANEFFMEKAEKVATGKDNSKFSQITLNITKEQDEFAHVVAETLIEKVKTGSISSETAAQVYAEAIADIYKKAEESTETFDISSEQNENVDSVEALAESFINGNISYVVDKCVESGPELTMNVINTLIASIGVDGAEVLYKLILEKIMGTPKFSSFKNYIKTAARRTPYQEDLAKIMEDFIAGYGFSDAEEFGARKGYGAKAKIHNYLDYANQFFTLNKDGDMGPDGKPVPDYLIGEPKGYFITNNKVVTDLPKQPVNTAIAEVSSMIDSVSNEYGKGKDEVLLDISEFMKKSVGEDFQEMFNTTFPVYASQNAASDIDSLREDIANNFHPRMVDNSEYFDSILDTVSEDALGSFADALVKTLDNAMSEGKEELTINDILTRMKLISAGVDKSGKKDTILTSASTYAEVKEKLDSVISQFASTSDGQAETESADDAVNNNESGADYLFFVVKDIFNKNEQDLDTGKTIFAKDIVASPVFASIDGLYYLLEDDNYGYDQYTKAINSLSGTGINKDEILDKITASLHDYGYTDAEVKEAAGPSDINFNENSPAPEYADDNNNGSSMAAEESSDEDWATGKYSSAQEYISKLEFLVDKFAEALVVASDFGAIGGSTDSSTGTNPSDPNTAASLSITDSTGQAVADASGKVPYKDESGNVTMMTPDEIKQKEIDQIQSNPVDQFAPQNTIF